MSDRETATRVFAALRRTPVGDSAVLVGSSGLFGFETSVPALTEDIDVAIAEEIALSAGDAIATALADQGFRHEFGTATFNSEDGITFDLLGHGDPDVADHVSGSRSLRVMVFEDLSRIINGERSVMALPIGGFALTPAGFCATKLLTERGHKGAKDKLQALLVIAERAGDPPFVVELGRLLAAVAAERREDLRASAQEALLALSGDPSFDDAGARGYGNAQQQARQGLVSLQQILGAADA